MRGAAEKRGRSVREGWEKSRGRKGERCGNGDEEEESGVRQRRRGVEVCRNGEVKEWRREEKKVV